MLSNFRKRFLDSCSPSLEEQQPFLSPSDSFQADGLDTDNFEQINDSVAQQRWTNAMEETVYVPGRTCAFCTRHSETVDVAGSMNHAPRSYSSDHAPRSLPSFRSVMEVLYPPSYLGTPLPDPPSYSRSDSSAHLARGDDPMISPFISSTMIRTEGTPLSRSRSNPLVTEDPALTGVPSEGTTSGRVLLCEPNPPAIEFNCETPEEPLPVYSRIDQRRPRFAAASDILGPYPPLAVISRTAR